MSAVVTGLFVYPVKSCRGIALTVAELGRRGIHYDREWMVVDAGGRFLTQRTLPQMARIATALDGDALHLTAPGLPPLEVPLAVSDGPRRRVEVWGDICEAIDEGDGAAGWLAAFLGISCRLVRLAPDWVRPVDGRFAPPGSETGFSDGFSLLLLSEASLADLNGRLQTPLPMERFRPNLVVAGCAPFAEDRWKSLRIGDIVMHGVKLCSRCKITTTDQTTGTVMGDEPLATLATYRRNARGIVFGQNVVHTAPGRLALGDAVEVLAEGEPV